MNLDESALAALSPDQYSTRIMIKDVLERRGLTLDGQPASVFGMQLPKAVVQLTKCPGVRVEFHWQTLADYMMTGAADLSS